MHPGGQQAWSPAQASTRRSGGGRRRESSSSWVPVAWGTSFVNGVCQATHHGVQHPTRPASVAWGWSLPPCTCFPPPSLPLPCCPLLSSPKVGMTGQHLHRRAGEGRTPSPTPASGGAWPLRQGPGFCSSCGWSLGGCFYVGFSLPVRLGIFNDSESEAGSRVCANSSCRRQTEHLPTNPQHPQTQTKVPSRCTWIRGHSRAKQAVPAVPGCPANWAQSLEATGRLAAAPSCPATWSAPTHTWESVLPAATAAHLCPASQSRAVSSHRFPEEGGAGVGGRHPQVRLSGPGWPMTVGEPHQSGKGTLEDGVASQGLGVCILNRCLGSR